jgi:hypothetical protein
VRGEILAFDEFHHQGREVGRLLEAVDRGNVWVVQRGQDFSFTLEPCEAIRVAGDRYGQHLDRNGPLEIAVGGAIDLTHTTRTDLRGDFVGTDVRAGSEGQVALKYMSGTAARSGLLMSHADLLINIDGLVRKRRRLRERRAPILARSIRPALRIRLIEPSELRTSSSAARTTAEC